ERIGGGERRELPGLLLGLLGLGLRRLRERGGGLSRADPGAEILRGERLLANLAEEGVDVLAGEIAVVAALVAVDEQPLPGQLLQLVHARRQPASCKAAADTLAALGGEFELH